MDHRAKEKKEWQPGEKTIIINITNMFAAAKAQRESCLARVGHEILQPQLSNSVTGIQPVSQVSFRTKFSSY